MNCFNNLEIGATVFVVVAMWTVSALVLIWIARHHRFLGKTAFIAAFIGLLLWLLAVGLELSSQGLFCKKWWSLAAWPGIALLPIAWFFFIFDYTLNVSAERKNKRIFCIVGFPLLVGCIAFTNARHELLYGANTYLSSNGAESFVVYERGPLFFAIAAGLYVFVIGALTILAWAFWKAHSNIRPFLATLFLITLAPFAANAAYIGWSITILGFDPTAFTFSAGLIAFSWMLANNRMMDTEALGRDSVFLATQDPVIIIDSAGRFSGANPSAHHLFGECLPKRGEHVDHLQEVGPILGRLTETAELSCAEPITLNGRVFDPRALKITGPIGIKENIIGWSVTLIDITEQERYTEELRQALLRAEAANKAKIEFIAVISHELRTPLTSVKGGLELVLGGAVGDINVATENILKIAQKNSLRLQKLIESILEIQLLDHREETPELQYLDPEEILAYSVENFETTLTGEASISVTPKNSGCYVLAAPDRLQSALDHVLSNAVKFSRDDVRIECFTTHLGDKIRISIRDYGVGIPVGKEETVFGMFSQIDYSSTRAAEGAGVGMYIAKRLIEDMRGTIFYESKLGEGTTVHIDLDAVRLN